VPTFDEQGMKIAGNYDSGWASTQDEIATAISDFKAGRFGRIGQRRPDDSIPQGLPGRAWARSRPFFLCGLIPCAQPPQGGRARERAHSVRIGTVLLPPKQPPTSLVTVLSSFSDFLQHRDRISSWTIVTSLLVPRGEPADPQAGSCWRWVS
jgi:hypothetical protein